MKLDLFLKGLALVVGLMLLAVVMAAVLNPSAASRPWYEYVGALLFGTALVLLFRNIERLLHGVSERVFLSVVIGLFLVSRLWWILSVPTLPYSDFNSYNLFAELLRQLEPIENLWKISRNLSVQPWGYPIALAIVYSIFGNALIVGKLLNVVAGVVSLWLVYKLTNQLSSPSVARAAAILFLLWPAQLMLTSVLASEHLGLMFVLASFLFLLRRLEREGTAWKDVVLAGSLLAIASTMRATLIVALAAALIVLLLARYKPKKKLVTSALFLVSFLAAYGIYLGVTTLIYKVSPIPRPGFALLVGTNSDSNGIYNESDARIAREHGTVDEVDRLCRDAALQRIKDAPLRFITLMFRKVPVTWADDAYGAYYSTELLPASSGAKSNLPFYSAASQFFHILVLLLGVVGCFKVTRHRYEAGLALILMFVLGGTLLHSILETQARYHYVLAPALLIFAAVGGVWRTPNRLGLNQAPLASPRTDSQ